MTRPLMRRMAAITTVVSLVAGCQMPPPMTSPTSQLRQAVPIPPLAEAPGRPSGRQGGGPARAERYGGGFDGGRITVVLTPLAAGRVQVVASSPAQPPCTIAFRSAGAWAGDVLTLENGIRFTRRGPALEMSETEPVSPHCSLQGTLRRM